MTRLQITIAIIFGYLVSVTAFAAEFTKDSTTSITENSKVSTLNGDSLPVIDLLHNYVISKLTIPLIRLNLSPNLFLLFL
jgi:hypothetical protein